MSGNLHEEPENVLLTPFDNECSQRRIRHITSIQVRNLTPFPVRDAFASALLQPSEQSQFTTHGHLSDDLDLTIGRKRSRRISVNSFNTIKSRKYGEGAMGEETHDYLVGSPEPRGRLRRGSRVSFSSGGSLGPNMSTGSSGRTFPLAGAAPTIRPTRPRTSSTASSISSHFYVQSPSEAAPSSSAGSISFSTMLPDNSQKGLEKVIKSRLVETFISITVPPPLSPASLSCNNHPESPPSSSQSRSRPSTPPRNAPPLREKSSLPRTPVVGTNPAIRKGSKVTPLSPSSKVLAKGPLSTRHEATAVPRPRTPAKSSILARTLSASTTHTNGKTPIHTPPVLLQKSSLPFSPSTVNHARISATPISSTPNYLSTVHRPSTNPSFTIDPQSNREFAEWTDLSGEKLKVEVWGKVGLDWHGIEDADGTQRSKGKENESLVGENDRPEWKVLEEWNINLADLVPLPEHLASHPSHLPSNTLLVTLAPHGQTYCLPPSSRSSSPSAGYISDPESGSVNVRGVGELILPGSLRGFAETRDDVSFAVRPRRGNRRNGAAVHASREGLKTAGWQDLLKLVTLQSVILDTEDLLSDVVLEIGKMLEGDIIGDLKREASERENLVEKLRIQGHQVTEASNYLRERNAERRKQLRQRGETLSLAKKQLAADVSHQIDVDEDLADERTRLSALQKHLSPTRTTLITILSAIFAIELHSPPDLLFTILSVPLPIPLSTMDPGPPLSLSDHKEVTEDAVATALGYAAQVVQMLAAYLNKGLVYPITCVGSRSLIRDGISAMVGPRMFPLFSKGVDTYRFEYGVFLLNKDIEMLMADRDLRAMDMRHTLPNLKNLLLTLTDGEDTRRISSRVVNSPAFSASGLESPRALTLMPSSSHDTDTLRSLDVDATDGNTPPSSGATTPTVVNHDRKSRSLLGLYPLAGFLRSRYPSVVGRPSVKSVAETPEGGLENGDVSAVASHSLSADETGDDDEDRRTVQGVILDGEPEPEGKRSANGYSVDGEARLGREKSPDDAIPPSLQRSIAPSLAPNVC